MGNPKLQYRNKHVGLRHLGDNIYAPRNNITFENALTDGASSNIPLVVITYFQNNSDTVHSSLEKIVTDIHSSNLTLIVVDNGSTDKTWAPPKMYIYISRIY